MMGKQIAIGDLSWPYRRARWPTCNTRRVGIRRGVADSSKRARRALRPECFPKTEAARGNADLLGNDDFIRERILQDAVLVNARLVGEGVRAHHRFIGRD